MENLQLHWRKYCTRLERGNFLLIAREEFESKFRTNERDRIVENLRDSFTWGNNLGTRGYAIFTGS